MTFFKKNLIIFILFLAGFFVFFSLSQGGMYGDDAIYSARSVGLVDFMFAEKQPTPLQLFERFPQWANFSNHDHPPLIFWIQHIFLIFGSSVFLAKLASTIFGLGTILLIYLWIKEEINKKTALLSALFLTINPYFIWFSRSSYLEIGVIFFIILTLYFFSKFLRDKKYWFYFGLSLGLALLTKYTALFILPVIFFYLLFYISPFGKGGRGDFKIIKPILLSFLIVFIVISPVIIYNVMMYKRLGHFDLQWAGLLNQDSPWSLDRNLAKDYLGNLSNIWNILGNTMSFVYLGIAALAIIYVLISLFEKGGLRGIFKNSKITVIILLSLFFLIIFFTFFITPELRFLVLFTPFLAIITAVFFSFYSKEEKSPQPPFSKGEHHPLTSLYQRGLGGFLKTTLIIFAVYQAFFTINSVVLTKPIGQENIVYASIRNQDYGVNNLDKYLYNLLKDKNVVNRVDFYKKLKRKDPKLQKYKLENSFDYKSGEKFYPIFVWDPNINWFSGVWLFEKRRFYDNLPFFNAQEFVKLIEKQKGVGEFYFIKVTEHGPLTTEKYRQEFSNQLEAQLIEEGAEVQNIYRNDGEIAFKIYKK